MHIKSCPVDGKSSPVLVDDNKCLYNPQRWQDSMSQVYGQELQKNWNEQTLEGARVLVKGCKVPGRVVLALPCFEVITTSGT